MNDHPVAAGATKWFLPAAIAVAAAIGAWLRLDQFASQVLIDDEWHAVHQVIHRLPGTMLLDFGFADYSIPLGILDWYEAQWFGLSEVAMRVPMLACGLATLVLLPLYVARRAPPATAALFALLLALSPLLVIYSRMARPYAITLLLGWSAHAAYEQYRTHCRFAPAAGVAYALCAALATWLHPIVAPFVAAPPLAGLWRLRAAAPDRRAAVRRWLVLALPTIALTATLILPPLVHNAHSMTAKSGIDAPTLATLAGVWYAWLGTSSTAAVAVCLGLAAAGASLVWRRFAIARTGVLGLLLTLTAIFATRPMFSYNPISTARYLLPAVPLSLLAVAAGVTVVGGRLAEGKPRRLATLGLAGLVVGALAVRSPLWPLLRHPNNQTLHLVNHFDWRPAHNGYRTFMETLPLSGFWASLAAQPPGTMRIAAAPFHFESFLWDAPRWERLGGQAVIPGFLTGLCVDLRPGETPRSPAFRLRNAVHLADDAALVAARVDYVVWQKPYTATIDGRAQVIGANTAHCEGALRARFGAPFYEDATLIAFRAGRGR